MLLKLVPILISHNRAVKGPALSLYFSWPRVSISKVSPAVRRMDRASFPMGTFFPVPLVDSNLQIAKLANVP